MPGLYGIAGENIRRSWSRLVEATRRVAATGDLRGTGTERPNTLPGSPAFRLSGFPALRFEGENVCFGKTDHGLFFTSEQLIWDKNESSSQYAIIADGYLVIDNHISDSTDRAGETLSLLLQSYIQDGCKTMISKIRTGVFNILIYDSVGKKIILINDRFGINPIYYHKGRNFIFSYNMESILRTGEIEREADDIGLAELLIIGHPLRDRTYIRGLERMPFASVLTYNIASRTIDIKRYFVDNPSRQPATKLTRDYVDQASSLFEQACRRLCLPGKKYCLMLSGGCDSRLILAAWPSESVSSGSIFSLSWGARGSLELKIAKRIAEIKGINHYSMELEGDSIAEAFEDTFYEIGNLRYPNRIVGAREMKRLGAKVAIDGLLGGSTIGGLCLDTVGGTLKQIINALFRHLPTNRDFIKSFSTDDVILFIEEMEDEIKKDIEDEVKSYRDSWDLVEWTCRKGEMFRELANLFRIYIDRQGISLQGIATRSQLEIIYPFLDYDFYDFCMTIPIDLIIQHKLYMKLFKYEYSQYSTVTYSKSLLPLTFPSCLHKISERMNHTIFHKLLPNTHIIFSHFPIWWTWDNWDRWIRHDSFKNAFCEIISDSGVIEHSKARNMMEAHERYDLFIPYGLPMLSLLSFVLWAKELRWKVY